jgi:large subunit ribosomal protein L19
MTEKKATTTASDSAEAKKDEKVEDKKTKLPEIKTGMTIRVFQKIKETNIKGEEKERTQYFDGLVIARKHGNEKGGTFTVRKVSNGVGVEKIYPINLPTIEKIEIKKTAKIRRAKLTFLKKGYKKKLKETLVK